MFGTLVRGGAAVLAALVVSSLVVLSLVVAPAAAGELPRNRTEFTPGPWISPVDGPIVTPFDAGDGPFGIGGHTGIDLAAEPGAAVRASARGTVSFAGLVAGARFVVVAHGGGLRTTYGFLASMRVQRGDTVEAGAVVGTAGGGQGHDPGVLHFGLRRGERYLDPALLFESTDLTAVVRLVPPDGPVGGLPSAQAERRSLLRELGRIRLPRWVRSGASHLQDLAGAGMERAAGVVARRLPGVVSVARSAGHRWATRWAARALTTVLTRPALARVGLLAGELLWHTGRGVSDWWRPRRRCSRSPAPPAPTRHHLVAVAGLGSRLDTGSRGKSFDLPVHALGYQPGRVEWFSYADAASYRPAHTWAGVEPAAARLAADLASRRHSRTPVDLVGHSQGGVVIEAFLKLHHRGNEHRYPPIGRVVTIASPHAGSALAGRISELADEPGVGTVLGWVSAATGQASPHSTSVTDLAPRSSLLRRLRAVPLPAGVPVTTVGAVGDAIVTADRTRLPGAAHVVVDPRGFSDHSSVVDDPETIDAVRRALAGAPPRCRNVLETVRARVEPFAIRTVTEHLPVPSLP
ncbi:MAG TPA: peptidoglycan DD-metalloendopeptidase family protein [Acidimicrobiia bacterium]|nr:peptidoglycan DD-metalloendopeptidase family protein [Acidimicrobiia bacterium]